MRWSDNGDSKVFRKSYMLSCDGNIGEAVEQEEKLYDEVKNVREFAYICDRVSAGRGCEAAVTAEQDLGGLCLWSAVSYCTAEISSYAERGCLYEFCKASNTIWK